MDGGTVRRGQVFRSTAVQALAGEDVASLRDLGIRTVYDLRTDAEKLEQPDRVPDGVEYAEIDVMADSTDAAPAQMMEVLGRQVPPLASRAAQLFAATRTLRPDRSGLMSPRRNPAGSPNRNPVYAAVLVNYRI
jgi:hypothetical protein